MVRQRIYGILADYEDQNDHDTPRSAPVLKLIADRLPGDPDLASQPTLSRFENAVSAPGPVPSARCPGRSLLPVVRRASPNAHGSAAVRGQVPTPPGRRP